MRLYPGIGAAGAICRTLPPTLPMLAVLLVVVAACRSRDPARGDSVAVEHTAPGSTLRVAILGDPHDARIQPVREAIDHWNSELARLGLNVQLDSGAIAKVPVPEDAFRAASAAKLKPWGPFVDARLRAALSDVPGDIVIGLSRTDLISFAVPLRSGRKGIVGVRRSDVLPLSLPNTVRNVVAHEIGHVIGLSHNADSTTLMCGRPASCRPAAFASDRAYFFPLTAGDEQSLRRRWP
jgi:hypothetical protein